MKLMSFLDIVIVIILILGAMLNLYLGINGYPMGFLIFGICLFIASLTVRVNKLEKRE